MDEQGHYVTSVQLRDQFNWPLRETSRRLVRLLAKEGKVVIAENPFHKKSYAYGLKGQPLPTKETWTPYKAPQTDKERNNKTPKAEATPKMEV